MPFFTKRSRVIDAMQYTGTNGEAVLAWANAPELSTEHPEGLVIATDTGTMVVDPGEWVVRGALGDLYPVSGESFDLIYEAVKGDDK